MLGAVKGSDTFSKSAFFEQDMVCYKLEQCAENSSTEAEHLLEGVECLGLLLLTSVPAGLNSDCLQLPRACVEVSLLSVLQVLATENLFPNAVCYFREMILQCV